MVNRILLLLILFFYSFPLTSQEINGFQKVDFGYLCDYSIAYEIAQDSFGCKWVATEEGLLRHNSQEAFLFNEYKGLPSTFSNKIQNVYIDKKHNIWASSDNHLAIFSPETNSFDEIEINAANNNFSLIYDIKEFDNHLWIASFNGLWRISLEDKALSPSLFWFKDISVQNLNETSKGLIIGTSKGSFYVKRKEKEPILVDKKEIFTAVLEIKDDFIIGSRNGQLMKYDKDFKVKTILHSFDVPIFDILKDGDQNYFIATDGKGIILLNNKYEIIHRYVHNANDNSSLPNDGVYDLLIGQNNQLWVASYGGGIAKSKIGQQAFSYIGHLANSQQGLSNNFTRAICKTSEGDYWFGTKEGISIRNSNGTWQHIPSLSKSSSSKDIILTLSENKDYIWAGTYGNGAFKIHKKSLKSERFSIEEKDKNKIPLDKVYTIMEDEKGVWFAGIGGPLVHLHKDGGQSQYQIGQIREIKKSPSGQIYTVGRQGVHRIIGDSFYIVKALSDKSIFDYSTINCISFENENEFWIGTNGDGLVHYNTIDTLISFINISKGLPSDVVQGIMKDGDNLWVSTSRGLVLVTKKEDKFNLRTFDERDGLLSATFNYGAIDLWDDHTLAIGTPSGVMVVDLNKISKSEEHQKLYFENIEVIDSPHNNSVKTINLYGHNANEIELKYWQNFIKVKFACIDHLTPEKHRYSWYMKGVSDQWSLPQTENEINFANLSPGDYQLKIGAMNSDGALGKEIRTLNFRILSPWYASRVAYFLYSILGFVLIIASYKIGKTLVKKKNADEQISFYNNITHELKTPLSILLNKLEDDSINNSKSEEVKTTIHRLNSLFDQLLNFKKVNSQYYQDQKVSKIDVNQHFQSIIKSFQNDLDRKEITFNFENDYNQPYFFYKKDVLDKICYNLISNSVKYTGQGGFIKLKVKEEHGTLILTIADNGIGIPKDQQKDILKRYYRARNAVNSQLPGTGLGLMMVKNLVEIDKGKIYFVSEQGLGTSFTIELRNLEANFFSNEGQITMESFIDDDKASEVIGKYKVLIVEDNDELRIDMVEKLSEHFSIIAARNGREGYHKAKNRLPDLIITDLIMPEMDGNELCKTLQSDENTNHIPVFMMTVLNDSTQKVESIKSGINTYMTKPIDFPFLVAKINSVLEYKQKLRDKYLHQTEVEKATKFKDEREASFIQDLESFVIDRIKDEEIAVQDLCKHVGMSRTSLYMKLTEMIDQSPQNFIITTRMNHARNLLLQGGKTVQEVAFMVGFNNPKYFSTSFKKQFGTSPSGFLKSLNPE